MSKVRVFNALVQQKAAEQLAASSPVSRLLAKIAADPRTATAASAFKAFAKFKAQPVVQINLKQTEDGLKL
jgi:hypothetical protein